MKKKTSSIVLCQDESRDRHPRALPHRTGHADIQRDVQHRERHRVGRAGPWEEYRDGPDQVPQTNQLGARQTGRPQQNSDQI